MALRRAVLAILACDLVEKGARPGPETLARCKKGAEIWDRLGEKYDVHLVLSAGKADPVKFPQQRIMMSQMMAPVVTSFLKAPLHYVQIVGNTKTWGTRAELKEIIRHLKYLEKKTEQKISLHVVTSWYHMPRTLWLSWVRFGVHAIPHITWSGKVSFVFKELYKILGEIVLTLWDRVRKFFKRRGV